MLHLHKMDGQKAQQVPLNSFARAFIPLKKHLCRVKQKLKLPLIALGASAATHYPAIAELLGVELIVPEHADVAGAVGAAAGSVRQRVMVTVTQPNEGRFRIHLPDGPQDVKSQEEALALATQAA